MNEFVVDHPAFRSRTRYLELWGGLGDAFNHIYGLSCYRNLALIEEWETAFVLISSHNEYTWELFAWHPKASQITVSSIGYMSDLRKPEKRQELRLPSDCEHSGILENPVEFYCPDEDMSFLDEVTKKGPYIVFAVTASDRARNIPKLVTESALRMVLRYGYRVVVTGRNYQFCEADKKETRRIEWRPDAHEGVTDAVDRLTVPGTARLVAGATGILTCHSALCMLAWHMFKPTFLLYDETTRKIYFTGKHEGYSFGANRNGNVHMTYADYTAAKMAAWLEGLRQVNQQA